MIPYAPAPFRRQLGQAAIDVLPMVPPASPDPIYSGYTGIPGLLENVLVLGVLGIASWKGIHDGLTSKGSVERNLSWVYGIGTGLMGLLYLGGKIGLSQFSVPAVRVTPQ